VSLRSIRLLRTAVLTVLALSLAGFGGQSLNRVWRLMQEVDSLEREVAVLRVETSRLTAEVDRLRTDPEFIEQMARERLGLVKPGDRVYKLPPSPGPAGAAGQGSR
jgi:cell division protein FtsB